MDLKKYKTYSGTQYILRHRGKLICFLCFSKTIFYIVLLGFKFEIEHLKHLPFSKRYNKIKGFKLFNYHFSFCKHKV